MADIVLSVIRNLKKVKEETVNEIGEIQIESAQENQDQNLEETRLEQPIILDDHPHTITQEVDVASVAEVIDLLHLEHDERNDVSNTNNYLS